MRVGRPLALRRAPRVAQPVGPLLLPGTGRGSSLQAALSISGVCPPTVSDGNAAHARRGRQALGGAVRSVGRQGQQLPVAANLGRQVALLPPCRHRAAGLVESAGAPTRMSGVATATAVVRFGGRQWKLVHRAIPAKEWVSLQQGRGLSSVVDRRAWMLGSFRPRPLWQISSLRSWPKPRGSQGVDPAQSRWQPRSCPRRQQSHRQCPHQWLVPAWGRQGRRLRRRDLQSS